MIKQECIGIPDMILLLMIFCFKKIKIKAEIVLSPGGAYFRTNIQPMAPLDLPTILKGVDAKSPYHEVFFICSRNIL